MFNLFDIFSALVCPIYLPRKVRLHSPDSSLIQTCDQQCRFQITSESFSACLGVYSNYSGELRIKQLAIISSDEQCATSKECLLEVDPMNSQSFSCCCSSDNCTLKWRNLPRISSTSRPISIKDPPIISKEDNQFSWKIFFILFLLILILLLMFFILIRWKCRHHEKKNLDQEAFVKPSVSPAIEQLFFSTQPIHTSRNTIIYQTVMDDQSTMVLKVYQQINISQWNNETALLKSIEHQSIIK